MTKEPAFGRRRFLNGLTSIAGISTVGNAVASRSNENINERVKQLLRQGQVKRAKQYLKRSGIDHSVQTSRPPSKSTEDDYTAQDYFTKDESQVSLVRWHDDDDPDDVHRFSCSWQFEVNGIDLHGPAPTDVIGIAWEDSHWGPAGKSLEHSGTLGFGPNPDHHERSGYTKEISEPVAENPTNAAIVSLRDNAQLHWWEYGGTDNLWPMTTYGMIYLKLRKQGNDDDVAQVRSKYVHTWSSGNAVAFDGWLNRVTVTGGSAGINVDVPVGADSWKISKVEEL